MLIRQIVKFFDRVEDKVRWKLSHYPIIYGFIGGVGIVLFWRGVWHLADTINLSSILSVALGSFLLLITGVFVSAFIGNRLIITGLKGEKKLTEKEQSEIELEETQIEKIKETLGKVEKQISHLEEDMHGK